MHVVQQNVCRKKDTFFKSIGRGLVEHFVLNNSSTIANNSIIAFMFFFIDYVFFKSGFFILCVLCIPYQVVCVKDLLINNYICFVLFCLVFFWDQKLKKNHQL